MCAAFGIFPCPWLHFICLYSPHIMLPPSNLHWFLPCVLSFVKCAPFQVAFALSIFPPFAMFASFQLAFCFPIFSAIVMCASFRFAFSNSISSRCFSFFQDVNILEQAQFDSTNVQTPCKLQQLPPDLLFDTFRHIPSCAFVAFAQHRRCRGRCGATGFGSSWNWLTGIQVLLQSKDGERPKKKRKHQFFHH